MALSWQHLAGELKHLPVEGKANHFAAHLSSVRLHTQAHSIAHLVHDNLFNHRDLCTYLTLYFGHK